MNGQLSDFLQVLKGNHLDGFIVTNPVNIFYLTGFRGISPQERESILIFPPPRLASGEAGPKATLITAKLYQAEAFKLRSKDLKIAIANERNKIFEIAQKLLKNAEKVGFEEHDLKYSEFREFKKTLGKTKLVPCKNLIEDLRVVKTADEHKKIERAQIISQKAFFEIIKTLKIGQTETEIAEKLLKIIKSLGGQGLAFESIIASGPNSAKPHHVTGKGKVKKGEVLLFDFGAKYKDYCADLSRTVLVGNVNDKIKNIYSLVEKAQREAIKKITHGIKSHKPHEHALNVFRKENLGDYFLHGLGHGIGLEVHEAPHLKPKHKYKETKDEILQEGMVFSVEPGLYFPSWGGVRIEDLVTIKGGKAKVLGRLSEGLIEV